MMNYRSVDILAVIAVTLISDILAFTIPSAIVPIRILTLPLVLFLPGFALTSALFVRQELGVAERLTFSMGISFVIVILGGLVLNAAPSGLRSSSWAVLLGGITLAASAVALIRRREQGTASPRRPRTGHPVLAVRQTVLLLLAALMLCAAAVVSIIGAMQQPYPGFTQLWILPAGETNAHTVRLGVSNMELTTMAYRLDVNVNGKIVKQWPSIALNPHGKWEATLVLSQAGDVGTTRVEALLYRADAPRTPYRHVTLWFGT